jgi:acetyl-CoA carboxylase alpha subunit
MRTSAQQVIDAVLDEWSFRPWTEPGVDEAVLTGEGRLDGRRVAVILGEFAFLGGSVGLVASRRIVECVRRATAERLPLLASPASGGTRVQDGTAAFIELRAITAAITAHRRAALPYLVWLRDPTFGGVLASWGSLGQITIAEPGAALGFLGPRIYSALRGHAFPDGVQKAENLQARGLIDAVVPLQKLKQVAVRALAVICAPEAEEGTSAPTEALSPDLPADTWQSVLRTRREDRPGVRDVLTLSGAELIELRGTGYGEVGPGVVLGLARFGSVSCIIVGQDRHAQSAGFPIGPAALRVARRGIRLAGELGLPLVTVVDTPGAELSPAAEEGGLSAEIAGCLADLSALTVPSLCVLLGQGGGGAAIALTATQRVIAAGNAWLSSLPPEGASAILYRTAERAAAVAEHQGIGSRAMAAASVVHRIVDERPDAANEPRAFCNRVADAIRIELWTIGHPSARTSAVRQQ